MKQGLGAEKQRSGAGRRGIFTKKVHKCTEKGRQEGVFGPHRRERIAFLYYKTAKNGLGAVEQRRSAANQCIFVKKVQKTFQKETGGSAFGPHRRERIVFLGKFGDARLGRLKKGARA